ncbi:response regulator receiver protein [Deinococcus radiophilus]|uniref:Response regulator receiver protein n=2 Tax=Deinococcus radiophilus TaxID=32062 RepID=A0A3S0IC97_9DEIO|nr:response regulator receiver protein [Deinococcus radiophilus]
MHAPTSPSAALPAELPGLHDLEIVTCGDPGVSRSGQAVSWPARSAAELLWYLHAHPQGAYRARLLLDLWGDEETPAALGRFRVALHRLRAVLGGPQTVTETAGRYALHPAVYARSDVGRQAALLTGEMSAEVCQAALATAQGPYLPQLETAWVRPERDRLAALHQQLALDLSWQHCSQQQCDCSLRELLSAAEADPLLGENHQQRLLVCLSVQRGPVAATDHYRRYVRYLRQEVGDGPLPETQALAQRVRQGEAACHWRQVDRPKTGD